jgi:LCP family protein required for cell wall assembly
VQSRVEKNNKTIIIAAACLALIFAAALLWIFRPFRQYAGGVVSRLTLGAKPINILLIANNARDVAPNQPLGLGTAAGQADVILLAHLDPAKHEIYAITVPRDALFAQPHFHNTVPKIKTLFFMGDQETPARGPQYLSQAVSQLTGLPIDGYIAANFAGFQKAVDLVGGLSIDVRQRVYDPQNSHADFQPGVQHMDGAQVLAFIRVRQNEAGNSYRVNDYQRMQAEVEVLGILRNKLLDPVHAAQLIPVFVAKMKGDVATNLPQDRLIRLGITMAGAPVFQVPLGSITDSMVLGPAQVPGVNREGRIDGASYDVLDTKQIRERLAEFGSVSSTLGLPSPPAPQSIHVVLYGDNHMALHLEHLGFNRIRRVGGPTGENEVLYPQAMPAVGWLLARSMGTGNVYVAPSDVSQVTVRE